MVLKSLMEYYVRPLVEEYYDVAHLGDKLDAVLDGYDGWLKETLKDKVVLAVAVGANP